MKFSEKIRRTFIVVLLITLVASGITSSLVFNRSLNSFLLSQRKKEFNQISKEIEQVVQNQESLTDYSLDSYAKNKGINITFYISENNYMKKYIGINEDRNNGLNLVAEKYPLLNQNDQNIGYLEISYIEDIFEYDQSTRDFYINMVRNYSIIFIIALLLAYIVTIYINKSLSDSIVDIKEKTKKIRDKHYDLKPIKYDIYELDELSDDIRYLAKSLSLQEQYRSDYARDIAHELRTPITNLLLHLEGIQDEIIEADKSTIELLLSEVKRINVMIDNLEISFNKSEDITTLNLEELDITKLVDNVANSFIPLMNEKNINLDKKYEKSIIYNTDKNKMTQILSNIISNAIKAVDINGKISLSIDNFQNRIVIIITDNGIGMSQKEVEQIFDRFYRVDSVRNTKINGHGLGLSITKNFLDLLGYNITVNSTPNIGSEFIITMNK